MDVVRAIDPVGRLARVRIHRCRRWIADGFVEISGPALAAGLQAGDVILGVNGSGVSTVADLKREVAHAGHSVAVLIQREDAQIYIPVDVG